MYMNRSRSRDLGMRLHPMQENIGTPSYQMSLSAAQYRLWSISSGDRSTRLRMSFLPRALQGSRENAMTHGAAAGELDHIHKLTKKLEPRLSHPIRRADKIGKSVGGVENVIQAYRRPYSPGPVTLVFKLEKVICDAKSSHSFSEHDLLEPWI
jgi:hypothetical protein